MHFPRMEADAAPLASAYHVPRLKAGSANIEAGKVYKSFNTIVTSINIMIIGACLALTGRSAKEDS